MYSFRAPFTFAQQKPSKTYIVSIKFDMLQQSKQQSTRESSSQQAAKKLLVAELANKKIDFLISIETSIYTKLLIPLVTF